MHRFAVGGPLFPLAFIVAVLAVDWVSFIHEPPAINVTPWNPPAGLYVALLLLAPRLAVLQVFVALTLGDIIVRGGPAPLPLLAVANLLITAIYAGGAWLLREKAQLHPALDRLNDLVALIIAVPITAVPAALAFAVPYAVVGVIPWAALPDVTIQYWVGDVIGILAVTPALLVFVHRTGSAGPRTSRLETVLQASAMAGALLATFSPLVPEPSKLFYLLFLPVIWIAMRRGLPGAATAILATQVGVVLALSTRQGNWNDLMYYQLLMLALTATGLLVGAVVGERWRLDVALRRREAELTRVSRLSLLGEMASSLAHELNQPLFTTIGYTKTSRQLLLRNAPRQDVVDLMDRAVAEAERAADVLRGIRGFLRQGSGAARMDVADSIKDVLALARPDLQRHGIAATILLPPGLPALWVDKVQFDQVLLNLVRNSVDALVPLDERGKEIRISAQVVSGMVQISVEDNGPGVPEDKIAPLFDLFFTTKPSGMGLGLPISRSIVEAHGGKLWLARNGADGSCFSFTIPAATR